MKVLVTGGAGYIGSIASRYLTEHGYSVVILDDLSVGHSEAAGSLPLYIADLTKRDEVAKVFSEHTFDAVLHFAARSLAGESMEKPYLYYSNNLMGALNLLEEMRLHACKHIIFSSSCSVYGTPSSLPVTENAPIHPESVYASSKRMTEELIEWFAKLYGLDWVHLRYFNASGAYPDASLGEYHSHETHILPIACAVALGQKDSFELFGADYDTPDGSCIRDYIHVLDLASAHMKAIEYLVKEGTSVALNLGVGKGYSNKEIIKAIEKISGKPIKIIEKPRRPGDPSAIFADNTKARSTLGWNQQHSDLETIVDSAWRWHTSHPKGFI
jgi:UDP-glucose 4-epimerase